mgnify:CR=1 FL=1
MTTQKHKEGNHGDTTNEASTQIVPEKEPKTIEENPMPSYDANSPCRQVSAIQDETEKQDGKNHQQDITVDKENMMLRKAQTTQIRMEKKLNKGVQ